MADQSWGQFHSQNYRDTLITFVQTMTDTTVTPANGWGDRVSDVTTWESVELPRMSAVLNYGHEGETDVTKRFERAAKKVFLMRSFVTSRPSNRD